MRRMIDWWRARFERRVERRYARGVRKAKGMMW